MSPRYEARKLAGLCVYSSACTAPAADDSVWCPAHRDRVHEAKARRARDPVQRLRNCRYSRRWRRRRWAAGRCARCPGERDAGSFFCIPCLERLTELERKKYAKATAARPAARGLSASPAG